MQDKIAAARRNAKELLKSPTPLIIREGSMKIFALSVMGIVCVVAAAAADDHAVAGKLSALGGKVTEENGVVTAVSFDEQEVCPIAAAGQAESYRSIAGPTPDARSKAACAFRGPNVVEPELGHVRLSDWAPFSGPIIGSAGERRDDRWPCAPASL